MNRLRCASFVLVLNGAVAWFPASPLQAQAVDCAEWQTCRQMALESAERGDYETFHDLAWRAVQTGPPRDPDLLYLLARAQSVSGRPYDALVILERLADELGVAPDATTEDFRRARAHPAWPAVQVALERVGKTGGGAAATAAPSAPPAATTGIPAVIRATTSDAARFATHPFAPSGLVYDAVSRRFLYGDRYGRRLMVVGEGSDHAVELVRADSAGFHDVGALTIDTRRGDLWVVSTAPGTGAGALHKLQLISGRPLATFSVPAERGPASLADVAVSRGGAVLVLDAGNRQLLRLLPRGTTLQLVTMIDAPAPSSVAVGDEESVAFVAHRDGLLRIDTASGSVVPITGPDGVDLGRFERIRWHRGGLVGVHVAPNRTRHLVRLQLGSSGKTVTSHATLDASIPATDVPLFIAVSEDEVTYLVDATDQSRRSGGPVETPSEYVVRQVPLP